MKIKFDNCVYQSHCIFTKFPLLVLRSTVPFLLPSGIIFPSQPQKWLSFIEIENSSYRELNVDGIGHLVADNVRNRSSKSRRQMYISPSHQRSRYWSIMSLLIHRSSPLAAGIVVDASCLAEKWQMAESRELFIRNHYSTVKLLLFKMIRDREPWSLATVRALCALRLCTSILFFFFF